MYNIFFFLISGCLCNPVSSGLSDALEDNISFQKTESPLLTTIEISPVGRSSRTGKAIGYSPKTPIPLILTTSTPLLKTSIFYPLATSSDFEDDGPSPQRELPVNSKIRQENFEVKQSNVSDVITEVPVQIQNHTDTLKVEKNATLEEKENITPILQPKDNRSSNESSDVIKNNTDISDEKILEVTPLTTVEAITTHVNVTTSQAVDNLTESITQIAVKSIKNNGFPIEDDLDRSETSTVRALSLETAVGRRAADVPLSAGSDIPESESGLDAAAVAGICFGTLVLLALAGATSFVLYRRRYLNKPQTLNDKCSNPDSSGYIDDSTIRVSIAYFSLLLLYLYSL